LPWLSFLLGVLQVFAAWALWGYLGTADRLEIYRKYYDVRPPQAVSGVAELIVFVGIGLLLVDAVLFLMAYRELKKHSRRGWNLFFQAMLLNVAYTLLGLFIKDRGASTFFFSALGSAVGFYLLFQVRGKYKASGA
jgi:hypothetical protein